MSNKSTESRAERTAALFCVICNRFRFMYEEALERAPDLAAIDDVPTEDAGD